jgi:heme/copper-type cytochrome/quinol oxidase subunit 2
LFFGQCSEICGENHGFMPIAVRSTDINRFLQAQFINSMLDVLESEELPY